MDIVVLAKYVPDIDRIPDDAWDRDRGTLIRSRLEMAFNPLDRVALRMALAVKAGRPRAEQATRIVALSMGPPSALAMLKEAVAYGADGAVLLTDRRFAGADTIATAYTLARAIRCMVARGVVDPDFMVLAGMQSPDGDTAEVPAQVACFLDAPLYPYVSDVSFQQGSLELKCLNSVGFQRVRIGSRPFVATATRLYPDLPFYVDLAAMQRANETEVRVWGRDDLDVDADRIGLDGSRTRVIRIFEPERKHYAREPILVESEDFADRATRLMRELKAGFSSADAAAGANDAAEAAVTGGSYYSGDCVALCEMADERLAPVSLEIVSACTRMARQIGCRSVAVVTHGQTRTITDLLREHGAEWVWFVDGLDLSVFDVRERANAVAELLRKLRPQVVIAPATLTGRVIAPYISAQLDCGLTADCSALDVRDFDRKGQALKGILYQTRPALGGNIMATIVSVYEDPAGGRPQMATVRPGALPVRKLGARECKVTTFHVGKPADRIDNWMTVETRAEAEREINLQDFEVIVCAGMGVGSREAVGKYVEPFRAALEKFLGVAVGLGCSRAMVDAGVLPHAHQVGQTGIVVKPKIYFGIGVSGAVQHKIGMENSRTIVSVNRDPSAPMHGFADHAIVGEVERVLPALVRAAEGLGTRD